MRNKEFYSAVWYDIIRPEALKRANYRCSNCQAEHRSVGYRDGTGKWIACDEFMLQWCKAQGIKTHTMYLQVCHNDQNTFNNSPENLQVRCPRCHLKFDKDFRAIARLTQRK